MSKPPITSWEALREEIAKQAMEKGKGVTIRSGSVHEVDRKDVDLIELGLEQRDWDNKRG